MPFRSSIVLLALFGTGTLLPVSISGQTQRAGQLRLVVKPSGEIPALTRPGKLRLRPDQRINVLIVSEGYKIQDLRRGLFDRDVRVWLKRARQAEPFRSFRQAFRVFSYAQASARHIKPPQQSIGKTAFGVRLKSSSRSLSRTGADQRRMAQKLWPVLAQARLEPTDYFGPRGVTAYLAKRLIVVILVFDPARGRSGYSGFSRALRHPADRRKRIRVAVAHNTSHEFLHAFGRLSDEYLDDSARPRRQRNYEDARYVSNVVTTRQCKQLPWQHLLYGEVHNRKVDGVVGAFGNRRNGYHSEFRCLMNGTHDNKRHYGGRGRLRARRLCNFCRELTVFRLYQRSGLISPGPDAWRIWARTYRSGYYKKFPFRRPRQFPVRNSSGQPRFQKCVR